MRIADTILRGGHVSDDVLVEAWYSGARPAHLDTCDACAERALDMARWLEQTKQLAAESADAIFTPERLEAQQSNIMSRLEQLDRPSKLLSFPRTTAPVAMSEMQMPARQQHIGAWIAVAAACLVLGVIGGRLSVWEPSVPVQTAQAPAAPAPTAPAPTPAVDLYPGEIDRPSLDSLSALENLTPPQVVVARASSSTSTGRRR